MQYLVTGAPGEGKTNWTIHAVKDRAEKENRQVYYDGIDILDPVALPWHRIDGEKWYEAPVGSIIVIDEAQRIFRPRPRNGVVPKFASELETHRHAGLDLYLITQDPSFIDSHDRKLTHAHYHMMRKFGSSWVTRHEFKGVRDNVLKNRKDSQEHQFLLVKDDPPWYKSTEQDTSKAKVPLKVWLLVATIAALLYVAFTFYQRFTAKAGVVVTAASPAASSGAQGNGIAVRTSGSAKLSTADWLAEQVPRVEGLAYTAPVFDGVTAPTEAPYPAACVVMASKGCRCYSQQGTRLQVPEPLCLDISRDGFFVSWKRPEAPRQERRAEPRQTALADLQAGPAGFGVTKAPEAPSASILDRDPSQPNGRGRNLPPPSRPNS